MHLHLYNNVPLARGICYLARTLFLHL
jgi:hypothetical protein